MVAPSEVSANIMSTMHKQSRDDYKISTVRRSSSMPMAPTSARKGERGRQHTLKMLDSDEKGSDYSHRRAASPGESRAELPPDVKSRRKVSTSKKEKKSRRSRSSSRKNKETSPSNTSDRDGQKKRRRRRRKAHSSEAQLRREPDQQQEERQVEDDGEENLGDDYVMTLNDAPKAKPLHNSKKEQDEEDERNFKYFDLQLRKREVLTPVSEMSMDDDFDWMEELHHEQQFDGFNNGSQNSLLDEVANLRDDDEEGSELVFTPDMSKEAFELAKEKTLSGFDPTLTASTADSSNISHQTPIVSVERLTVDNLHKHALSAPQPTSGRPMMSNNNRRFGGGYINEDQEEDWVLSDGSHSSSDSNSPRSVAQALTPELYNKQLKKANPSTVKSYIASNQWQGHQRMLKNWRSFVQDSRRSNKDSFSKRGSLGNSHPVTREPVLFANRGEEARRISTGMIVREVQQEEPPSASQPARDCLSLDIWEVEQRKKVLKRSLKEAKRNR